MYLQNRQLPTASQRAFLVGLIHPGQPAGVVEDHLDELAALAESAGAKVVGCEVQQRKAISPSTFIGRGKAEEIGRAARELGCGLVIFGDDLTGSQVKNLEEILDLPILDRSALILEIFYQRARSREARTQVELAQLTYLLPRLTRRWSHLSRQEGSIGVRGGAGETQLEADRRMLRRRIQRLRRDLGKIERTRKVQRRGRQGTPVVALAGYTNGGKSTLFNRLTRAGARAEDRLFATLDPKLRQGAIEGGRVVVFADTVGFIRKLPHHLVASFKSTLEEITVADLVLHVVDRSHPQWQEQMRVAKAVLLELGVEPAKVVRVFNKVDLLEGGDGGDGEGVSVSAATGEGIEALKAEMARQLGGALTPSADGRDRPGAQGPAAP